MASFQNEQMEKKDTSLTFSIVIPLYNKRSTIARAVRSVMNQTYQKFELIVVDDGSTDGSMLEISWLNDKRSKIIAHSKNKGVSAARNTGIWYASYDFICFLDADDKWDSNFLEIMSRLVNVNPFRALYSVKHRTFDVTTGQFFSHSMPLLYDHIGRVNNFFYMYKKYPIVNSSTACVSTKIIRKLGGFPQNVLSGEDIYMWLKLVDEGGGAFADVDAVIIYRFLGHVRNQMPYYIKKIMYDGLREFRPENQKAVLSYLKSNALKRALGFSMHKNNKIVREMAYLFYKESKLYGCLLFIISLCPSFFIKIIFKLKYFLKGALN